MTAATRDSADTPVTDPRDPTRLDLDRLQSMLRTWCRGIPAGEAAVELLIAHDYWLRRRDFVARCVHLCEQWRGDDPVMAALDWSAVAEIVDPAGSIQPGEHLDAGDSDKAVLTIVASLAGVPLRKSLRDLLDGLDWANTGWALQAFAHANRWHTHRIAAPITGTFTQPAVDLDQLEAVTR